MGSLARLIPLILTIFAGWGLGDAADKVVKDKIPYYPQDGLSSGMTFSKVLKFIAVTVVSAMILKWIGKKFNIKILK